MRDMLNCRKRLGERYEITWSFSIIFKLNEEF